MAITMDWRQEATVQYSRQDVQPREAESIVSTPTHNMICHHSHSHDDITFPDSSKDGANPEESD